MNRRIGLALIAGSCPERLSRRAWWLSGVAWCLGAAPLGLVAVTLIRAATLGSVQCVRTPCPSGDEPGFVWIGATILVTLALTLPAMVRRTMARLRDAGLPVALVGLAFAPALMLIGWPPHSALPLLGPLLLGLLALAPSRHLGS